MAVDIWDDILEALSDEEDEKGPGFGWTSPEQSNIMLSQVPITIKEKQIIIIRVNLIFARIVLPGITDLP